MFQNIIEVLILSAIQGISEFLPISSSAHLILVSSLYEFKSNSLLIDISLHLGSLLAIIYFFRNDLLDVKNNKRLRVITHEESQGQSAALRSGVIASQSPIIATLDGDGQNDPSDLPGMIKLFRKNTNQFLFVGGVRVNRKDGKHRLWASSIAKYSRLLLLKDNHPDSGCGIKVFHKDLFLRLPYFDHMHRFLSALAHREGAKILEFNVKHRERQIGVSNYTNLGRLIVGISDILGVIWLRKRMPKNKVSKEIYK